MLSWKFEPFRKVPLSFLGLVVMHFPVSHRDPDSHAHILEYGAARHLPLEGVKTIRGGLLSTCKVVGVLDTSYLKNPYDASACQRVRLPLRVSIISTSPSEALTV